MAEQIDLTKLEPVPFKNNLAMLNEYILNSLDFVNKFGHFNENKLYQLEVILDEIESKVLLLERKLDSLNQDIFNGMNNTQAQPQQQQQPQQNYQQSVQTDLQIAEQQQETAPVLESIVEEAPMQEMDENLKKYVKMYNMGVPLPALKMKMQSEGYDPSLIDALIV